MAKVATSLSNIVTALDRSSSTALHRQLYNQLREAILSGRLGAGTRLPSTRELAGELDLARNTMLNAFDQLYAEGYLARRVGDGTYVSKELPDDLLKVQRAKNVQRNSLGPKHPR
jgi:GntR family transcriptional regulator/MocR family aminotransferase